MELLTKFLFPDFGPDLSAFTVFPAAIAEFWMVGYPLTKGIGTKPSHAV